MVLYENEFERLLVMQVYSVLSFPDVDSKKGEGRGVRWVKDRTFVGYNSQRRCNNVFLIHNLVGTKEKILLG